MNTNAKTNFWTYSNTAIAAATLSIVVAVGGLSGISPAAFAEQGGKDVAFTWSAADHGQGAWGGGVLYSDGSANGAVSISDDNGQTIAVLYSKSWSLVDDDNAVNVCFDINTISGGPFPPEACMTDLFGQGLPITGGPVTVTDPDGDQFTFRVTPIGQ
jgi:hypothetical protein